jgi:hypothetical protein
MKIDSTSPLGSMMRKVGDHPVVGTARWAWAMGLVDASAEQTLLLFGYCHPRVSKVELIVDQNRNPMGVTYKLYVSPREMKKYHLYQRWMSFWCDSKSVLGKMIRNSSLEFFGLKHLMDYDLLIRRSVTEFLGVDVPLTVEVCKWER